jgi:hypothetical protein
MYLILLLKLFLLIELFENENKNRLIVYIIANYTKSDKSHEKITKNHCNNFYCKLKFVKVYILFNPSIL